MSDTCESCGCPEGVDGHDVLYRKIEELKKVANLSEAIGTMDADERSTLCDRITELERAVVSLHGAIHSHHSTSATTENCTWATCVMARRVMSKTD